MPAFYSEITAPALVPLPLGTYLARSTVGRKLIRKSFEPPGLVRPRNCEDREPIYIAIVKPPTVAIILSVEIGLRTDACARRPHGSQFRRRGFESRGLGKQ